MDVRREFVRKLADMDLAAFIKSRESLVDLQDEYKDGSSQGGALIAIGLQLAAIDCIGLLRFGARYSAYIPRSEKYAA